MSCDYRERNGARNGCVYKENLEIDRERFLFARRMSFIKTILILGHPMKVHHDQRS